ncbi:DoxX family protein [Streptomyces anulatus]|uniref:DoxX family protein n=1 Tax=Streptomyces anulatus TaxID=1892 RepID=UPI003703128B
MQLKTRGEVRSLPSSRRSVAWSRSDRSAKSSCSTVSSAVSEVRSCEGALGASAVLTFTRGLGVPLIGSAAAIGVVLHFIGAVVTHLRVKDCEIAPPVVLALLAAAALVLRVLSA